MSRWVLVELEEELPAYRQVGLFCAFQQLPGVVMVCDLSVVSAETLKTILLKPDPVVAAEVTVPLQPELEWAL